MRNIFTQLIKKTDRGIRPGENNLPYGNLSVAHHNKEIAATGRTTTTYIITNDNNDSAVAGSFFLLPDPYCEVKDSEDNYLQDFISEEEELMLYDQPIIANHSPYQI